MPSLWLIEQTRLLIYSFVYPLWLVKWAEPSTASRIWISRGRPGFIRDTEHELVAAGGRVAPNITLKNGFDKYIFKAANQSIWGRISNVVDFSMIILVPSSFLFIFIFISAWERGASRFSPFRASKGPNPTLVRAGWVGGGGQAYIGLAKKFARAFPHDLTEKPKRTVLAHPVYSGQSQLECSVLASLVRTSLERWNPKMKLQKL